MAGQTSTAVEKNRLSAPSNTKLRHNSRRLILKSPATIAARPSAATYIAKITTSAANVCAGPQKMPIANPAASVARIAIAHQLRASPSLPDFARTTESLSLLVLFGFAMVSWIAAVL
ncbi:hypothetical protein chiPu_0025522 [Chiloscyllium punctatum]|uniref:Uncharacterized protein n=1 Tax=Chiloscyllium punctatum TaxID=137246 RepID=A0A401TGD9_CHIPU|nr:hypothetical protein [Chiloscyllium punctatum]